MKKQIITALLVVLWVSYAQSQTVQLDFKHFAGKEYTWLIVYGDKQDTVSTGKLDKVGKVTLQLPQKYKDYVGMSRFMLKEGGGLDLVINNENFTVRSSEAQPNESNIVYTGSPENEFLMQEATKQQKVLAKAELAAAGLQLYTKSDAIYPSFKTEQQALDLQFKTIQNETARSPLYAARFREFVNYLTNTGSSLTQAPEQKQQYLNAFVRAKLDLDALYTSNHWSNVLGQWFSTHVNVTKNDSLLIDDAQYMANRIKSNTIYTAFAEKVVVFMAKAGKDELMHSFGSYLSQSGRLVKPNHNVIAAMGGPEIGQQAPDLILPDGKQLAVKPKTLVFFYESGCNNCENEMLVFRGNYDVLKSKGYEVISIAADVDRDEYRKTIANFPWTQKYSDFKGHTGVNFATYAVVGTPTIFVIDDKGNVAGRYAKLVEANILN